MNRNNLSWVDNKVFNPGTAQPRPSQTPPQPAPFSDMMPAQSQDMPQGPSPTGVSPSTYQAPMTGMPDMTSAPPQGLSPSTYQAPMMNMPSQTGTPPQGFSPSQGVSPATYGTGPSMDMAPMGVSMPARQAPGTEGTLTRTDAYGQNPFVQGPPTIMDPGYIPAYLRTIIGKRVRAEFNIGTNLYMDRTGVLREVGISYFVLEDNVTHAMVMCDLYSLKFMTSL